MTCSFTVLDYALTLEGLSIYYEKVGQEKTISLAPFPTCELFQALGIIQHYDSDQNEPIIIEEAQEGYEDEYGQQFRRTYQAWIYWNDFVKEYHLSEREAQIIAEHYEQDQYSKAVLSKAGLLPQQPIPSFRLALPFETLH